MPLTTESEAALRVLAEQGIKALDELPAAEGRAYFNEVFKTKPEDREPVARVEDLGIPVEGATLPARLYAPEATGPLPVIVHFHGGGWVYLNLETHDGYCRTLANGSGAAVLAVEYRKAPEHRFPVPLDDCYGALGWVAGHAADLGLDGSRIGVVGDSAGGNLSAAVALCARDEGGPKLAFQMLTYPALDATMAQPSIEVNAEAPLLGRAQMCWFWSHYVPAGTDLRDPLLSPLHAEAHAGLPPAFIATAEFDPLRDEAEAYAERLQAAGVEVECRRFDGVFHGFMLMYKFIPEGRELIEAQSAFARSHFA